jgi:hypothetical protein
LIKKKKGEFAVQTPYNNQVIDLNFSKFFSWLASFFKKFLHSKFLKKCKNMEMIDYKIGNKIVVNDKMQKDYHYFLSKAVGKLAEDFHQFDFFPELTPEQMLSYGVFEGKYLNDCESEFPNE